MSIQSKRYNATLSCPPDGDIVLSVTMPMGEHFPGVGYSPASDFMSRRAESQLRTLMKTLLDERSEPRADPSTWAGLAERRASVAALRDDPEKLSDLRPLWAAVIDRFDADPATSPADITAATLEAWLDELALPETELKAMIQAIVELTNQAWFDGMDVVPLSPYWDRVATSDAGALRQTELQRV